MSALQTFKGAEAFVSCRLSSQRKKFDRARAKGNDLGRYAGAVIPVERSEYVRDELRSALYGLTCLLEACETMLDHDECRHVPAHVFDQLRLAVTLFNGGEL